MEPSLEQKNIGATSTIKWHEVTWYSKLGAIILFVGVVPALCFYIGMQYQLVSTQSQLSLIGNNEKTSSPIDTSIKDQLFSGEILYQDINYDKHPDLGIQNERSGDFNPQYDFYVYNPEKYTYELSNLLPRDLTSPTFDTKAQTVTSYESERGPANFYTKSTYHWQDNAYVLIRRVTSGGDVCAGYILTTEELRNDKLVVTKTEQLGPDDVLCHSR